MVTTASQKVEIVVSVVTLQPCRHAFTVRGESRLGAGKAKSKNREVQNWECPPFAKNAKVGPPRFALASKGGPPASAFSQHGDGRRPDRPVDGQMRPSLREDRGKRKQVPPLRRRMRSGSGRNDKARAWRWLRCGRNDNRWEYFHSEKPGAGGEVGVVKDSGVREPGWPILCAFCKGWAVRTADPENFPTEAIGRILSLCLDLHPSTSCGPLPTSAL